MRKNRKTYFIFTLLCCTFFIGNAQQDITEKEVVPKEKEHKLTFSVDFINRYIWRGQSWGGNYFVIQPTVEYAPTDKWTFGIWATSNFKKEYFYDDEQTAPKGYQELDLYLKYNFTKYISLELWDFYWPTVSKVEGIDNSFFNYGNNGVKTLSTELNFDFTESKFPAHATISTLIAGNDFRYDEDGENPKQNYTTYIELGYLFSIFKEIEIDPVIGAVLNNKAQYYSSGDYDKISFVNMSLEASRTLQLGNSFEMPLTIKYVHNGATKNTESFGKNFLLFGVSINRI